jgi:hypothetical protein
MAATQSTPPPAIFDMQREPPPHNVATADSTPRAAYEAPAGAYEAPAGGRASANLAPVKEGIFGGCGPEWKKQFSWWAFKLSNEPKSLFVEPRQYFWLCGFNMHPWQQWTFLLYRFLFLIYWGFWIIYDAIDGSGPKWFVYLTHWNVLLVSYHYGIAYTIVSAESAS